ncbi:uncharacterized protein LOC130014853 [Mercurialis annua]|uniref:uncharacterized protein LOC130014853 n=1 Tax=Mercurialis annua TaxID=3986 RepID=UPI0024AE34E4|nr:uncharacterized protein LOC130014853 [Mercurialis annua]
MASYTVPDYELPSSPYYLHPSENPSLVLVSPLMNGQNYHSWFRSMRMCLLSKNKLKFVDVSIAVPSKNSSIYPVWERCNTMVLSWILRSLTPSIAQSILWIDNALDVWKDLFDRFSQGSVLRISDLQEEIYSFKQNNLTVTDYFTHLKMLWDEYVNLRMIPVCMCIPQCSCNALTLVKNYQEADCVIRFLKGLNEGFSVVRTQVLMVDPLPKINKVFSLALQHERELGIGMNVSQIVEPHVFAAQSGSFNRQSYDSNRPNNRAYRPPINGNLGQNNFRPQGGQKRFYSAPNNGKPMCSHCGVSGHTVEICFKKHGYPPGYRSKFRPQTFVNQVGELVTTNSQEETYCVEQNGGYDNYAYEDNNTYAESFEYEKNIEQDKGHSNDVGVSGVPPITQAQYAQLMSLLQQNIPKAAAISSPRVNTVSTNFVAEETGATNHIVCSLQAFTTYELVSDIYVTLPNCQKIAVTHKVS